MNEKYKGNNNKTYVFEKSLEILTKNNNGDNRKDIKKRPKLWRR